MRVDSVGLILFCARNHLRKYAACAPDVDGRIIVLLHEDDLWWSVPPGDDMVGEVSGLGLSLHSLVDQFLGSLLSWLSASWGFLGRLGS